MKTASIIGYCQRMLVLPTMAEPMSKPAKRMLRESSMMLNDRRLLTWSSLPKYIFSCWPLTSRWSFPFRMVVVMAFNSFGRRDSRPTFLTISTQEFSMIFLGLNRFHNNFFPKGSTAFIIFKEGSSFEIMPSSVRMDFPNTAISVGIEILWR